jgi:alpha,alpha-trehalase
MTLRIAPAVLILAACASATLDRTAPLKASVDAERAERLPPSLLFPGLFQAVAMTDLYEPKDWTDATPLGSPEEVMAAWKAAGEPTEVQALADFVDRWFQPPAPVEAEPLALDAERTLSEHVAALWPVLTREAVPEADPYGSLLPLPAPYIVPGGRFREVYYWDAYFTLLGLPDEAARADMVRNFASEVERFGRVPNANRTYYLSRSQPPFLYLIVGLLNEDDPAAAYAEHLDALRAEHAFWMAGAEGVPLGEAVGRVVRLGDGSVLNRYWDDRDVARDESYRYDVATAAASDRPPAEVYRDLRAGAESGWDYSSRWLADGESLATIETTRVVPADLNALLYGLERAIAAGCERAGDEPCARGYEARAEARREAMSRYLWSDELGYFADYDLAEGEVRDRPTAAMLYPLFTGAATREQGARTAEAFEAALLAPGGVLATPVATGEQWDAPNAWAPLQWIASEGLAAYGRDDLAAEVRSRWTRTVARSFCESGKLVEKYDVVDLAEGGGGEYPTQDGFGWTNGVTVRMIADDAALAPLGRVRVLGGPAACAAMVR